MITPEDIQDDYSRLADTYDIRWQDFLQTVIDWVIETSMPNQTENKAILDLGCGTGAVLAALHDEFHFTDIVGVDVSRAMLEKAQKRLPKARFFQGNIEDNKDLPEHGARYDIVLSLNILHHLNDPDAHILQLQHFCKPDGIIYLCDFAPVSIAMKVADYYWQMVQKNYLKSYQPTELKQKILKIGGVEAEDILMPDGFWRLQIYKIRPKNR